MNLKDSRWARGFLGIAVVAMITLLVTQPILANVMPDSPLYPLKRLIENLNLMLTFDEVGRAKKLVEYAKLRLVEAEYVARKGKDPSDLIGDYEEDMSSAVGLMDSAKPEDMARITEIIVNASIENYRIIANSNLPNKDYLGKSTLLKGELAIRKLAKIDPNSAYRISLEYVKNLLKNGDKISIEESDRVLKVSVSLSKYVGSIRRSGNIVELVKSIVNEATNLSNAKKENLTTDILRKGLSIYGTLFR